MEIKVGDKFREDTSDEFNTEDAHYILTILYKAPKLDTYRDQSYFAEVRYKDEYWYTSVDDDYLLNNTERIGD